MNEDKMLYAYGGTLSGFIEKELLPHAPIWINLEDIMFHERSQTEKDKYCTIPLTLRT